MAKKQLDWSQIDPADLPKNVAKLYHDYKALYTDAMKPVEVVRDRFEEAFVASAIAGGEIDDTMTVRFNYRFGGLSVAKDQATATGKAKTKWSFRAK